MIIKLHKAANNVNLVISYNLKKLGSGGEMVMYKNLDVDTNSPADIFMALKTEFKRRDWLNVRSHNISFHASINPDKDEYDKIDIQKIAEEYMSLMGYAEQPWVVIKHTDTGRLHYHIISHRINEQGKRIKDNYEIRKSHSFERDLNRRLSLLKNSSLSHETKSPPCQKISRFNIKTGKIQAQIRNIFNAVAAEYRYANVYELGKILLDYDVELIERDGYYMAAGCRAGERKTRGVRVDDKQIVTRKNLYVPNVVKEKIRNLAEFALRVSKTESHARNILAKHDIGVQFLKNDERKIYGVYFIDHKTRMIVKSSDISKNISAKAWQSAAQEWSENIEQVKRKIMYTPGRSVEHLPYCLNTTLMYNPWQNTIDNYKDLQYSHNRQNSQRII